jgi:predicted transcriptional regulator
MASIITAAPERETHGAETLTDAADVQSFMDVLTDSDCRAMMACTTDEALTARELSEAIDLPLSTTYRKLECLTEARLLVEQTRLAASGSHPSEYRRAVDDVVVSVGAEDGATLTVTRNSQVGEPEPLLVGQR